MNLTRIISNHRLGMTALPILLFAMTCACSALGRMTSPLRASEETPAPALEEATAGPQEAPTAGEAAGSQQATATVEVPPTLQAGAGLNTNGPWLLIAAADGLWVANPDGTGLARLLEAQDWQWQDDLRKAIQTTGSQVAVLTSEGDRYHKLALNLISLPTATIRKVTDLTTSMTEPPPDAGPGDPKLEAMRAIVENPSYAWSPDGTRLAFVGALDGPKADIYIYDTSTEARRRISRDDAQDYWPSWSPDGNTVVYLGAEAFGTGAGITPSGVWAAASDGSESSLLYKPTSAGEQLFGWRDNATFVVDSWDPGNGTIRLRMFDMSTRQETMLQPGAVAGAAVAPGFGDSPGAVIFGKEDGLYLLKPSGSRPEKVSGFPSGSTGPGLKAVSWRPLPDVNFVMVFGDGSMATLMTDGSLRQDAPFPPSGGAANVAGYGLIWGWTNSGGTAEGAWISGPGLETLQVFEGPASAPIWDPKNNLLFFGEGDLYRTTFMSYFLDTMLLAHFHEDVKEVAWVSWQ